MKKSLTLLLLFPLLCSCSGSEISNEKAFNLVSNFEVKLDQATTFSFYERKAVAVTETTRSTSLYQVFFEENYIHSYIVNEDSKASENNSVQETWAFIKDLTIYDVTTNTLGEKVSVSYPYTKEQWEAKMKEAFDNVRSVNYNYIIRIKNEYNNQTSQTKITSRSKNDTSLVQKVERMDKEGKIIRSKTYTFVDSLISEVEERDDYSKTNIKFSYKVTTQEAYIPDL